MKKENYIKTSKESIWWVIRHLIGIFILYIIYIMLVPHKEYTVALSKMDIIQFSGIVIATSFILWVIYVFLVDFSGYIIRMLIEVMHKENNVFDTIPKFKVPIPITKDMIEKFDKKFKRRIITIENKKETECNYNFCQRIINQIINEKLK